MEKAATLPIGEVWSYSSSSLRVNVCIGPKHVLVAYGKVEGVEDAATRFGPAHAWLIDDGDGEAPRMLVYAAREGASGKPLVRRYVGGDWFLILE